MVPSIWEDIYSNLNLQGIFYLNEVAMVGNNQNVNLGMEEKIILKNVRDNKGMFQVKKESIISFLDVKDLVNKKA